MRNKNTKRTVGLVASVAVPLAVLLFVVAEHSGWIDHWRGLDEVQQVADRFDLSYAPDASRPVYPEDAEWKPTIALIRKYSKVKLRTDKQPQTIARFKATLSTNETPAGFEWSSPSTPFGVLYRRWPQNSGVNIPLDDFAVVGTIGDLQNWIAQSRADFHFLINDVLLGILAIAFGYWVWRMDRDIPGAASAIAGNLQPGAGRPDKPPSGIPRGVNE